MTTCMMCDDTGRRYMEGRGWVRCPEIWRHQSCEACYAEVDEPCRPGCLGYAIEHDQLAGTEPCS